MTKEEFNQIDAFGVGEPNTAFAQYFVGESFLKPLTDMKAGEIPIFNVTFEPGGEDTSNEWLEKVGDEEYKALGEDKK